MSNWMGALLEGKFMVQFDIISIRVKIGGQKASDAFYMPFVKNHATFLNFCR